MKRITGRWHRWHLGRYELHWFLGSGGSVKWWRMRYRRHFRRTGFAIGPLCASLWRRTGQNDADPDVRRHRAGWWGPSRVFRVHQEP